jgi:hypothetical protein
MQITARLMHSPYLGLSQLVSLIGCRAWLWMLMARYQTLPCCPIQSVCESVRRLWPVDYRRWLHRFPNLSRQVFDWLREGVPFVLSSDDPVDAQNSYDRMTVEEIAAFASEIDKAIAAGAAVVWDGSPDTRPRHICKGRVTPKRCLSGRPRNGKLYIIASR